ncbi:1-deoxy-D-xylulose-5-phosphate synthase, partial [Citrobacter sp. AAK_AS5]
GDDVAILAVGSMVDVASQAADQLALDGIEATVFNARFVNPLDRDAIVALAQRCRAVVTIEENTVVGGFGAGVLELLSAEMIDIPVNVL